VIWLFELLLGLRGRRAKHGGLHDDDVEEEEDDEDESEWERSLG